MNPPGPGVGPTVSAVTPAVDQAARDSVPARSGRPGDAGEPGESGEPGKGAAPRWRTILRRVLTAAAIVLAGVGAYQHRSEISTASSMLGHLHEGWLLVAVVAELGSMVVFARLQRWLLRSGGVRMPLVPMLEITLAGNALSTSLPGGPAWAATWAFAQLRRRGANRMLAGWVILVAGALSSFAIFVILAVGAWVAGGHGPVASLRWLAAFLAAIPPVVALGFVAARRSAAVRRLFVAWWKALAARLGLARIVGRFVRNIVDNLVMVRPGGLGWFEAFGLALANWLYDALCLVACTEALGVHVPWRGVLVIYGLTQVSASLPITPGGIGVVEGSMAALLVAYGTPTTEALAVVVLYRIVSFWGLVPVGWGAWLGLELARRGGLRNRAHPWAAHQHDGVPARAYSAVAPERILRPEPCVGCPDNHPDDESADHRRDAVVLTSR